MDRLTEWTLGILKLRGVPDTLAEAYVRSKRFAGIASWLLKGGELEGIECEAEFEEVYGNRIREDFEEWHKDSTSISRHAQSYSPELPQTPHGRMGSIPTDWLCDSDKREVERYVQMKERLMIAKYRPALESFLGYSLPLTPEQQAELQDKWQQHPCILLVPIVEPTPDNQGLLTKALVDNLRKLPLEAQEEHLSMLLTVIRWGHAFHQMGFIPRELETRAFFSLGNYWCVITSQSFCRMEDFLSACHSAWWVELLIHNCCIKALDGFWDLKAVSDFLLIGTPLPRKAGNYTVYLPEEERPPSLELNLFPCLSALSVERIYKHIQPQRVEPRSLAVYECGMHFRLPMSARAQKGRVATALQFWNQHAPEGWHYEHSQAAEVFRRTLSRAYRALHRLD